MGKETKEKKNKGKRKGTNAYAKTSFFQEAEIVNLSLFQHMLVTHIPYI